jgi:hypothetical protein
MLKTILIPIAMFWAASHAGEKICSPYFERINLSDDYKLSSIRILKSKIETSGSREMVIPGKDEERSSEMGLDSNLNWAKSNSCQYLLLGTLTRLGESVQFSVKVLDVSTKIPTLNKLYKASGPEDLDPIFSQVADALKNPNFVAQQSIYDVTNTDAARLKQKRSNTNYAFGLGYLGFPAQSDNTFGISAAMVWDARKFMGELDFSLFAIGNNNGTTLSSVGVNLYKPLNDFENSVYLGGGAGLGAFGQRTCQDDAYGTYCSTTSETTLFFQGSAGYIIGRASDFNMRLQSDVKLGMTTIDGKLPFGIGLRVILGFDY